MEQSDSDMLTLQMARDIREIERLVWRYAQLLDDKRYDEWEECFTDDVELNYSWGRVHGRRGLGARCRELLAPFSAGQHFIGNLDISCHGDSGTGRAYFFVTLVKPRRNGTLLLLQEGGVYHHEYRRTPEGWRFSRIDCVSMWQSRSPMTGLEGSASKEASSNVVGQAVVQDTGAAGRGSGPGARAV